MRTDHWLLSCIVALGCGSPAAEQPLPSSGAAGVGGSGAAGAGGMLASAGSIGGAGSGSVGGAGTAAQAGAGNSAGLTGLAGTGGAGGTSGAAGTGGAGGANPTSFQCSQLMGPNVAGEWFDAGFEAAVGSAGWQVKAPHHSFVDDWAKPDHDVWREQDCQGTYTSCAAPRERTAEARRQSQRSSTPRSRPSRPHRRASLRWGRSSPPLAVSCFRAPPT